MHFRIADTFTDSIAKLNGEDQKLVNSIGAPILFMYLLLVNHAMVEQFWVLRIAFRFWQTRRWRPCRQGDQSSGG